MQIEPMRGECFSMLITTIINSRWRSINDNSVQCKALISDFLRNVTDNVIKCDAIIDWLQPKYFHTT